MHALPQAPQLAVSVWVSRQAVPQSVWPAGQAQRPATQLWPRPQTRAHAPQLVLSPWVSTQRPAQAV
jgi:hypothetical protein